MTYQVGYRVSKPRPSPSLGEAIRRLRKDKGLGQLALAQRSGLSPPTISFVERCKVDPRWSTLEKLADGLGVDMGRIGKEVVKVEAERLAREDAE